MIQFAAAHFSVETMVVMRSRVRFGSSCCRGEKELCIICIDEMCVGGKSNCEYVLKVTNSSLVESFKLDRKDILNNIVLHTFHVCNTIWSHMYMHVHTCARYIVRSRTNILKNSPMSMAVNLLNVLAVHVSTLPCWDWKLYLFILQTCFYFLYFFVSIYIYIFVPLFWYV